MADFSEKPLVKRFVVESDPSGEMWVEIRQATVGAFKRRESTIQTMRLRASDYGGTEYIFDNSDIEIAYIDLYHTLSGIGGMYITGEDGERVPYEPFKFKTEKGVTSLAHSESDFAYRLDNSRIPPEYIREIHKYILEVNPSFNPNKVS